MRVADRDALRARMRQHFRFTPRLPASPLILLVAATAFLPAREARAQEASGGCVLDGVRVAIADGGDASFVEISARLSPHGGGTCSVDWSHVALAAPEGSGAAPTIAIAETFVDHKLIPPLVFADGVAAANPREWTGDVGAPLTVAARWIVEGTTTGLRVEIPRATFPHLAHPGAKVERRVKSARVGTAKFGALGDIAIVASPPGAAGGVGPTGPLDNDRVVAEFLPSGEITETVPPQLVTLDALRDKLPRRVLDLSPENQDGWNDVGKRAYAAALHGDPVVASLGVSTLAWLASGLDLSATRIAKTADAKDVAAVPPALVDAIGDVGARLAKRGGARGKLLPLGRPSVFRKALSDRPWADPARAKAAKDAVARLATVQPQDLTAYLMPAIVDGAAAPVDPPAPAAAIDPNAVVPMGVPSATVDVAPPAAARTTHRAHRRRWWPALAIVAALAVVALTLRE